eukprot:TRINITY_DN23845_c0_g1_i1.p1 TRINITY_DN23845_c0_g1~~TRINITY_DN23845_c0_g1_i1.p1  ORF type:complete len:646 (-),score=85.92 TRINITY_DN23845_c0_g1_i1:25-1962(-)
MAGIDSLCKQGFAACEEEDWHEAATQFSEAVSAGKAAVKSGTTAESVGRLATALLGRSTAFRELGRGRGGLQGDPEILKASVSDARAAVSLRQKLGEGVDEAVCTLAEALAASGEHKEAVQVLEDALPKSAKKDGQMASLLESIQMKLVASSERKGELDTACNRQEPPATAKPLLATPQNETAADKAARLKSDIDETVDGRSPGTFRWSSTRVLPDLPALPRSAMSFAHVTARGWGPYLAARGGTQLVTQGQSDPALIDSLSFPLSLAWALKEVDALAPTKVRDTDRLHVVVLGATSKAEVRVWEHTNYWSELDSFFEQRPTIKYYFVGPELDSSSEMEIVQMQPPCATRFLQKHPELTPANTVCVTYNGGFGNFISSGRDELLWSWLPDLLFLADSGFLCVFFCANDYADLQGESVVHSELIGSYFAMEPCRNPFSMATTYGGAPQTSADPEAGDMEWFRGNSFAYVTQGSDVSLRKPLDASDSARQKKLALIVQRCQQRGVIDFSSRKQKAAKLTLSPLRRADTARSPPTGIEMKSEPAKPEAAAGSAQHYQALDKVHPVNSLLFLNDSKTLRLVVELPELDSIAQADLHIAENCVLLRSHIGNYFLQKDLPVKIDDSTASAKFSSKRRQLTVEASVADWGSL